MKAMHQVKLVITLTILMLSLNLGASETEPGVTAETVFAKIDDLVITANEFEEIFNAALRHKFYHGRVPENELKKFRQKVAEDIVIQAVVHRDAQKTGLEPDHEKIAGGVEDFSQKYINSPEWEQQREIVIPQLIERLERLDLFQKMEAKIKDIAEPGKDQVYEYYQNQPKKFTEPKRIWGSVILLQVPPSSNKETWKEAEDTAKELKFRIDNGEDFAAIAKQFSNHASAVNGGDLGYLHQGMLDPDMQKKVETLAINQTSDPIRVLEGITLFRMNGVNAEKLKPFAEVEKRAAGLLYRELQDRAWDDYVAALKASADIYINKKLYVQNNHE